MAEEFLTIMRRVGFRNQEHCAKALGVSLRTVNGYANGQTIPEPVLRLMRVMERYNINPEDVK
jgi:hypothetical protein